MSVYPEFLQHIHDEGLYVHGFNYEEMYNIMVYTLTHNIIPTTNFIYTYQQVDHLYEYLEELLTAIDTDESDETNEPNNNQNEDQNNNENDIIAIENPLEDSDIYESDDTDEDIHTSAHHNDIQNEYTDNQNAQALFNNYIQLLNNAANVNTNQNQNQNIYYTNLTYHNNYNIL